MSLWAVIKNQVRIWSHSKTNKQEWLDLLWSAVEKGLNDKIIQVKIKSWDLLKEILDDKSSNPIELKDITSVVGLLVDFLSENNAKLRERSGEMLRAWVLGGKFDKNEALTNIIVKGSKMNKAITRYNHWKLEFLVSVMGSDSEPILEKDDKKSTFPIALFLDFIEKMIIRREKGLNKIVRENVEKAFLIWYKNSNYDAIKDYVNYLDSTTLSNLSAIIPELRPKTSPTPVPEIKEESKKLSHDDSSNKKIVQLRKERLNNIKFRINK